MAEFCEVSVRREDGTEATHLINLDAVSYVEYSEPRDGDGMGDLVVHLNDGYWFTVSGAAAQEFVDWIARHMKGTPRGE